MKINFKKNFKLPIYWNFKIQTYCKLFVEYQTHPLHPNFDITNDRVRPLLFTISQISLYNDSLYRSLGVLAMKICNEMLQNCSYTFLNILSLEHFIKHKSLTFEDYVMSIYIASTIERLTKKVVDMCC